MKRALLYILLLGNISLAQNFHPALIDGGSYGIKCVRITDLDKDNLTDVIVANSLSNEIDWCQNNGFQGFFKKLIVSNYDGAYSVFPIDIDKDGDIDIVGCANRADRVTWWENNGVQSFTRHDIDSTFDGAYSVYPIDIDRDGDIDIIGAAETGEQVAVWYNDSLQNFTKSVIGSGIAGATIVHPADIDGDSDIDIIATARLANKVFWFKNNAGSFITTVIDSMISAPQSVFVKDLDKDGDADIAVVGISEISWYENIGSGMFSKHVLDAAFANGSDVSIDDFDNDGNQDILATSSNGKLMIWENDGGANFYTWQISSTVGGASFARIGDINSDGLKDLVTAAYLDNTVSWWRQESLSEKLSRSAWNRQTIYPGVEWSSYIFDTLFNSHQSINVLDINLDTAKVDVVFDGVSTGFKKTSDFGKENKAIAAVNGNFFNTVTGGSVNYITRNYTVINNGTSFMNTPRDEAALTVSQNKNVEIMSAPAGGNWSTAPQQKFMISCGPRLLSAHEIKPNAADNFTSVRNPRTFAGVSSANHLLLFTVDGRAAQADGMSILEIAKITRAFHCEDAFNLDGGGSTTMWVDGQPDNGVVNYPSDNNVFDHLGERAVANAILILPAKIDSGTNTLCDGDSILFNGNYLTTSGIYFDTVNTNNKFGQDSLFILNLEVTTIATPMILSNGNTLSSSVSGTSYNWYLNGNLLPAHTSAINPPSAGNYLLVVEVNGCFSDTSAIYSFVPSGINQNKSTVIRLLPNPVNEKLSVAGLDALIGENVVVYSAKGELIFKIKIKSDELAIDCSQLSNGAYILQVKDLVKKFVVKH
ncbi:MAG: Fibronectin type domain protein [Bacteroidota bacterium]|nr:Fibronectin type domain protein [Bacteroidota bacterium]